MLGVLFCGEGELGVDGGDALFFVVWEVGSGVFKVFEGFFDVAVLDGGEGCVGDGVCGGFEDVPELGV